MASNIYLLTKENSPMYLGSFPSDICDNSEKNERHLENGISRRDFLFFNGKKISEMSNGQVFIDDVEREDIAMLIHNGFTPKYWAGEKVD